MFAVALVAFSLVFTSAVTRAQVNPDDYALEIENVSIVRFVQDGPITITGAPQGNITVTCNPCSFSSNSSMSAAGTTLGGVKKHMPASWENDDTLSLDFDFSRDWVGAAYPEYQGNFDLEISCTPNTDGFCAVSIPMMSTETKARELTAVPWAPAAKIGVPIELYVRVKTAQSVTFSLEWSTTTRFGAFFIPIDSPKNAKHTMLGQSFNERSLQPSQPNVTFEAWIALQPVLWYEVEKTGVSKALTSAIAVEAPRFLFNVDRVSGVNANCISGREGAKFDNLTRITGHQYVDHIDLTMDGGESVGVISEAGLPTGCYSYDDVSQSLVAPQGGKDGASRVGLLEAGYLLLLLPLLHFTSL